MRAALVAAVIAALASTAIAAPDAPANPRLAAGLDDHVGAGVPLDLVLTASTGEPRELGSLFAPGRPVVLVLAYARCTMLCSVVLRGMADAVRAARAVPGRDYLPVVVSLDSAETADEGARRQNALLDEIHRPNDRAAWPYFVADRATIDRLADALGFRYAWDPATKQYAHPAVAFVLAPDGTIAEDIRGVAFPGLDAAIARAARGIRTTPTSRDLLACFHFDPSLRRYGAAIGLLYKLGGATVLGALGLLILGLVRWERRRR